MHRPVLVVLTLLACCVTTLPSAAPAAIVYHEVDYTGTVAGGAVSFDFTDGSVLVGQPAPTLGMRLLPSNGGANMQIQFESGSGGGVVITSGSPSFLAKKLAPGVLLDGTTPLDTESLPGFSTQLGVGVGKIRFFGGGNFASGEKGYVGFRLAGGAYFGWAEVSAIDDVSFTVHRFAFEDSGAGIAVGRTGLEVGVEFITSGGGSNQSGSNWPVGDWRVAAILLDGSGNAIGELSTGFTFGVVGTSFPAFVNLGMWADGANADRIRVFRRQDSLDPGDVGVEFADFSCDENGSLDALCDASSLSAVGGGLGYLRETDFTGIGAVPNGSVGAANVRRYGLGNSSEFNWPVGDWYVKAVTLNAAGQAVGPLSSGFDFSFSGTTYPIAALEVFSTSPLNHTVRLFRKQSPILPGDTGVEYADFSCDDGSGGLEAICDATSGGSPFGGIVGRLVDSIFSQVGTVPSTVVGVATTPQLAAPSIEAFPNPFNPRVSLRFVTRSAENVSLRIYDLSGRLVRSVFEGRVEAGEHVHRWSGQDDAGRRVGSGVYFAQLRAGGDSQTQKIALVR